MPNWCSNTLTVFGPRDIVERFMTRASGHNGYPLEFNALLPVPAELTNDTESYEWRMEHWGCEGGGIDAVRTVAPYNPNFLATYVFLTPWSPPCELFDQLAQEFPQLAFGLKFSVPLSCCRGMAAWTGGTCVLDETREPIEGVDTFWCGPDGREFPDGTGSPETE